VPRRWACGKTVSAASSVAEPTNIKVSRTTMSVSSDPAVVGIDGISVYVPRLYVDLSADWARARAPAQGTDSATLTQKLNKGIGVRKMAIPDAHEDSATMAAMAAKRLIDRQSLDLESIGYLVVGTETTVDQSKSIGAYVLGMLARHYRSSVSHVGCPQIQFACIGATYALEAAAALVKSGLLRGRSALVIASDIARYPKGDPGECTQGAGAVAMHVAAAPRLLELDGLHWPSVTVDERDFFRPNWSSEAVVDGRYSVDLYLDCLDRTLRANLAVHGDEATNRLLNSDHFVFHAPFPRMAEYAAARLFRRLQGLRESLPIFEPCATSGDERARDREVVKSTEFQAWFATHCAPALRHVGDVGNTYSGAIYLSFASLVEALAVAGKAGRITFFSYGSGASAKLFTGILPCGFREVAHIAEVSTHLDDTVGAAGRRRALSLPEYERLHDLHQQHMGARLEVAASVLPPHDEFVLARIGTERCEQRVDIGYRYYDYVPALCLGTDVPPPARRDSPQAGETAGPRQ
jgi:hydroxymethylglutaryl-CoA synthase